MLSLDVFSIRRFTLSSFKVSGNAAIVTDVPGFALTHCIRLILSNATALSVHISDSLCVSNEMELWTFI